VKIVEEIICINVNQLANKLSSWKWSEKDTFADYHKMIFDCEDKDHYPALASDQSKAQFKEP